MTKTKNELKTLYNTKLKPHLTKLNKNRKKILIKIIIWIPWTIIWSIITLITIMFVGKIIGDGIQTFLLGIIGIAGFIVAFCIPIIKIDEHWQKYRSAYKTHIIEKIIHFIDKDLIYTPKEMIPQSTFEESKIYTRKPEIYNGDDHIKGKIDKTTFSFSEIHAQYTIRSKNRQNITIFKGLFFCIDFNKHFNSSTIVLTDTAEKWFGFLGKTLQSINPREGELVKLEDPEFESEFVVYSSDQIEARYILSPALMKHCTSFKKNKKKAIQFSFVNNHMYVTIPYKKDLFEPKFFGSLIDYQVIEEYHNTINLIHNLIETLQLNTRIWSKK